MTHPNSERLSDYLDHELDAEAARDLERHLEECPACQGLLGELRRVLVRAQALEDRPPRQDLWPGVAAAIGAAPGSRRGVHVRVPVLLAAAIALMLLSGGAVAWLLRERRAPAVAVAPAAPIPAETAVSATDDARGYDAAIRRLEAEVAAGGGRLDSTTVRVVRQKLALIDRAILEAERALAADSGNTYLHGHLAQTRLRKLDLLRRAAALAHQVS